MRRVLLAAVIVGTATVAQAADMPDFLRGSLVPAVSARPNWQGFYIGAQAGYGSSDENFSGANKAMVAGLLTNTIIESGMQVSQWPLMGKVSHRSEAFGGFAGYNSQWTDVVIGLEASFLHGEFGGSDSDSISRIAILGDDYRHIVTSTSSASILVHDFGTLRARGGYVINCFLPYMFGGIALGRADITRTATVTDNATYVGTLVPALAPINFARSNVSAQHDHLLYGFSAGLGVDVMLFSGLFLRAEYEYLHFTSSIDTAVNTGRVGIGYKF